MGPCDSINTFANPRDETFREFMEEPHEKYIETILKGDNLIDYMKNNGIDIPKDIKEYYVDSKKFKKYSEINDTLNTIKKDILLSKPMFKNVEKSQILQTTRESEKNKGFYIIKNYIQYIYTDFDGKKIHKEKIINEEEVAPKDCPIIKTEKKVIFDKLDLERSDYLFLFFPNLLLKRISFKYDYYIINYYKVGNKIVKGEMIYKETKYVRIADKILESLLEYADYDTLKKIYKVMKNILPEKIISFFKKMGIWENDL